LKFELKENRRVQQAETAQTAVCWPGMHAMQALLLHNHDSRICLFQLYAIHSTN